VRSGPTRLAGVISVVIALAGCGSDDDATPAASEPEPLPTVSITTATDIAPPGTTDAPAASTPPVTDDIGGPNATVSPDLPEEFAGEVRPMEVRGDALPEFDGSVEPDPARGMLAPVVIGENFAGTTVRIDAAADGPTLAVFLAHWCPHCNREVPRINQLRDEGAFPAGLDIIGISTGISPDRPNWPPSQWFQDVDWTYPVIADGVDMQRQTFIAADAYGLTSFPYMVLIGSDGKVLARWAGEHDPDDLLQLIEDNLPQ
jgi:thiol-disulfide isomerase/thioredoxin